MNQIYPSNQYITGIYILFIEYKIVLPSKLPNYGTLVVFIYFWDSIQLCFVEIASPILYLSYPYTLRYIIKMYIICSDI